MAEPRRALVLRADDAFLRTDLMWEALWAGLGRAPVATLRCLRHVGDRPRLAAALANAGQPDVALMPVHPELAAQSRSARDAGREVVLLARTDPEIAARLAAAHPQVTGTLVEDGGPGAGGTRAASLVARFGAGGFDYAGRAPDDLPVWRAGAGAILVGRHPACARTLRDAGHAVTELPGGWSWRAVARALRPRQYVKNVLLFLPLVAAHAFSPAPILLVCAGIVAFSAAASSIYVVNDLLDLAADRRHRTKCRRPFASGAVPIRVGMALGAACLAVALLIGALLGAAFLGVVCVYIAVSLAYSLRLKRMRWVDVFCLAGLYTLRVVAGAAAGGIAATLSMLVFVFPVFLTLGCVKRLTELARTETDARLPGRGYARADRGDLLNMAGLGVAGALAIFAIYTFSDQAAVLYPTRWIMWLALPVMGLWLVRMVALGARGKMDYDPIVFALRDRRGIGLLLITLSLMFWSAGLWSEWLS